MKNLTLAAAAMFVLVGCGNSSTSSSNNFSAPVLTKKVNWPTLLTEPCLTSFGADQVISFNLDYLISGKRVQAEIDFTNQIDGNYVMTKNIDTVVSKSFANKKSTREIYARYNKSTNSYKAVRGSGYEELNEGVKFEVCPSMTTYDDETIQGIALRTSNVLHATNKALKEARPDISLVSVELSVAPKDEVIVRFLDGPYKYKPQKMYSTENASYHPYTKTITMYPHSETYIEDNEEYTPFWTIPMVAAHEYGHHVFQTLYSDSIFNELFKPNALKHSCFKSHKNLGQNFDKETTTLEAESQDDNYMWSIGALNEGFADLISYYSLTDEEFSLKTVKCFERNREVTSNRFANWTSKDYSDSNLKIIDGESEPPTAYSCNTPQLNQIHDAGAVFAYQANQVLDNYTDQKKLKLKTLLHWIETLAENYNDFRTMKKSEFLFHAFELLIKQADQEFNVLNATSCDAMDKIFPANTKYKCKYLR